MKVAIVGSREFPDRSLVKDYIHKLWKELETRPTIISGGARGVDAWAEKIASECTLPTDIYPADWDRYGKSAGFKRNKKMVEAADAIVAFWDGESKGTKHTIDLALESSKPLNVYVRRK